MIIGACRTYGMDYIRQEASSIRIPDTGLQGTGNRDDK
jgi:hypothetical protein